MPENQHDNETDPENVFVLYSNASCVTGRNIARYLGVPHGKNLGDRVNYLIRWGSSRGVRYIPDEQTLNTKAAVESNTDKLNSLDQLSEVDIPVPNYSDSFDDFDTYPILGRSRNHREGTDINLILQERDEYLTSNDFFTEYIPIQMEYRVHVAFNDVLKLYEKRLRSEEDNHPFIRNSVNGSVFLNPRGEVPDDVETYAIRAVNAMGLDFGAVDVILGEDDNVYVLEVNTAPSLDEANIQRYGSALVEQTGLFGVPRMEAVELDSGDEGEEGGTAIAT